MYLMLFSAAALALLFASNMLHRAGTSFFLLAMFILIQPVLTFAPGSDVQGTLLGSMQLIVSIISALALCTAFTFVPRSRLHRLFMRLWIVFFALALAESLGLRPVLAPIQELIYEGSGREVYAGDERDLAIYGRVRTTALASEPSFLADTLFGLALLVFMSDVAPGRRRSWLYLGGMIALSFFVSPSFKVAFYLLALLLWLYWPRTLRHIVILALGILTVVFVLLLFLGPIVTFVLNVVGGHLSSGSFYGRIGVAPIVGFNALSQYPLFGYGVGNSEGMYPVVAQAWTDSGAFILFPWYRDYSAVDLMSNGFWWQFSYLGILGGILFVVLLRRVLRDIGVVKPMRTICCVWIVWYAGAAFVDPQSWFMVGIFAVGALQRPQAGAVSRPAGAVQGSLNL